MSSENAMSAKDIAVIIKACAEGGVRQLFFGDLELYFGQEKEISQPTEFRLPFPEASVLQPDLKDPSKTQPSQDDEDDIQLLHVTDPMRWEELNTKSE